MKAKIPNKKERHRWRTILLSAGAVVVFAAGLLLVLLAHRPELYHPTAPANPNVVSPYLTHRLGPDFYNQVQLDEPFELVVDQAGLNDIFSRAVWPMQFDGVSFATPTVVFGEGQVSVMGQVEYKRLSSVVTAVARPGLDGQGRLNFNIQSVWLGALPITPVAKAVAEAVVDQYLPAGSEVTDPAREIAAAALNNEPFEPVVSIEGYTVRLERLTIEPGQARLRLAPVRGGER